MHLRARQGICLSLFLLIVGAIIAFPLTGRYFDDSEGVRIGVLLGKSEGVVPSAVTTTTLEQSFRPGRNNLASIGVLFTRSNRPSGILRFDLIAANNDEIVRSTEIQLRQIQANQYHEWYFEPIPDSANQSYRLRLSGSLATAKPFVTSLDRYPDGQLLIHGDPQSGDLLFHYGYRATSTAAFLQLIGERIVWLKPFFQLRGILVLGALVLVTLGVFVWHVSGILLGEKKPGS